MAAMDKALKLCIMGKRMKNMLFPLLSPFREVTGLQGLTGIPPRQLIVPVYHAVSDQLPLHLKGLYFLRNRAQFIREMDSLLRHWQPLTLDELISGIQKGGFSKPSFHLTLDDGLREISEIIAPVLLQKGIPATLFVNPSFVGNRDLFYRFKAQILVNLEKGFSPSLKVELVEYCRKVNIFRHSLLDSLQCISYNNRHHLDALAAITGMDYSHYVERQRPYLTEDELKGLVNEGFTVGGHSMDHPLLSNLAADDMIRQAVESVRYARHTFSQLYGAFAFPFTDDGMGMDFFDNLSARYGDMVNITFGTAGVKKERISWHIQRITPENFNLPLEGVIYAECLYYLMKAPFGKNWINRP